MVAIAAQAATYYTDSLSDCKKFAKKFFNTCPMEGVYDEDYYDDYFYYSWDDAISPNPYAQVVTCDGDDQVCANDYYVRDASCDH